MRDLSSAAHELATNAGARVREAFGRAKSVTHKGAIDVVTETDIAVENYIVGELHQRFPSHQIVAEESASEAQTVPTAGATRWVVDPLDGTVNFAHGIPHFAVLIAAQSEHQGAWRTDVAVTYDPMRDETYAATRGQGATLNGQPLRVSATNRLIDSVLATGFAYGRLFTRDDNHREFGLLNLVCQGVRRMGSAGLDLAYVAAGRYDGYWETGLKLWDCAGGDLLVREAGGVVTSYDGGAVELASGALVATQPALVGDIVKALALARAQAPHTREGLRALVPKELLEQLAD